MNFPNEIIRGRKKLYMIPGKQPAHVEVLVDCTVTGGMIRIPMTFLQFTRWHDRTELIQEVFPELCAELREVLISGNTPAEWNQIFGKKKYSIKDLKSKFKYEFEQ